MVFRITCSTTFDITCTGVRSHYKPSRMPFRDESGQWIQDQAAWIHSRNQQRNWETMNQIISMRVLPQHIDIPLKQSCPDAMVWSFTFEVAEVASLGTEVDSVSFLKQDAQGVPMIVGLHESPGQLPVISTQGAEVNLWFDIIKINNFS